MLSLPHNFNALSVFPHKMNDIRVRIRNNKKCLYLICTLADISYIERHRHPTLQPDRKIRAIFLAKCLALFVGRTDTCETQVRNHAYTVSPVSLLLFHTTILKYKTIERIKESVIFIHVCPAHHKMWTLSMDRWKRERARADNAAKRVTRATRTRACMYCM